ncbi:nucleotide exchange factor GrpE [Chloroflexota bacterium]
MRPGESEELNGESGQEIAEVEAIEALKQTLAEEKEKTESYLANWQRAQADFVNYKRRSEQEKEELRKFANSVLMISLLPALDDLERAFSSVPPRLAKLDWLEGIRLIERKLRTTMEAQGLSQIEALGKPFDPHLHEAMRQDKGEEGIIVAELEKGYRLYDRVIRPTKVIVGNGAEEKEE